MKKTTRSHIVRRAIFIGLALALAGACGLLIAGWGVGRGDFLRIAPGMTEAEVTALLGKPSHHFPKCSVGERTLLHVEHWGLLDEGKPENWLGRDYAVTVYFDGGGKVQGACLSTVSYRWVPFPEKVRLYLGF